MGEENMKLSTGRIYINDTEFVGVGLTDYDYTEYSEDVEEYFKKNAVMRLNESGELTLRMKVTYRVLLKLMGIWDWVLENCRNGRVKHLMRWGKNERVRKKNFKRALHLIAKNVYVKEKQDG